MTVTASQVFSFLEQHPTCSIDRREIHSSPFSVLRRNIRLIVVRLHEDGDDEAQETADRLRRLLSEWLTVPVPFDDALLESVSALGDAEAVERRWGHEIRAAYDHACAAARFLRRAESPARTEVSDTVRQLKGRGTAWKIYCHRRALPHFESIFADEPLPPDIFLHSVKDYREAAPFDVLVKVGPLRSKGWGSAPDAILSAPRFARMVQIVWSGCGDEDDFGYDPAGIIGVVAGAPASSGAADRASSRAIRWTRDVTKVGDATDIAGATVDDDELKLFHALGRVAEVGRATLLEIDDEAGILYSPQSKVSTLDPAPYADEPIGYRLPGETLSEGMYLIWPLLGAADLGAVRAGEGRYSRIWKERLRDEMRRAPDDLVRRLRAAGIELRNLISCVRQWCRPPSTVIHAPQQRRHFEMLVRVLGIDHDSAPASRTLRRPWWEYAWSEIGHARGEAIQTGIQERGIVDEQLFVILNDLLPEIRRRAAAEAIFELEIPDGRSLTGAVRFYRIRSIEDGVLVPETACRCPTWATPSVRWSSAARTSRSATWRRTSSANRSPTP
jgi:hypothetical protein